MFEGQPKKINQNELNKIDAEKRQERSVDLINFISKSGLYEISQHLFLEGNRKKISYEDFKNLLLRVNGITRDISMAERRFDGVKMEIGGSLDGFLFLHYDDKDEVLKYAFENSKEMTREDISYMIPAVINAVHYFGDGNGRLSRVIRTFLEENDSKDDFLNKLTQRLQKNGRDYIDISPSLIAYDLEKIVLQNHGWNINEDGDQVNDFYKQYGSLSNAIEYDENHKNASLIKEIFRIAKIDGILISTSMYELFKPSILNDLISNDYDTPMISPKLLCEKLSDSDLMKIINRYYIYKKEYTELFVDIFKNPDLYPDSENPERNLKEKFIQEIKENSK